MLKEADVCEKCGRIWFSKKDYLKSRYNNKCRFCGGEIKRKWITNEEYKRAVKKKLIVRRC